MKTCIKWLMGLSVFCVLLVPSIGAAQTVEPSTGLAVFDVEGDRVGPVVGILGGPPSPGTRFTGGVWFSMKVGDTTGLLSLAENTDVLLGTQFDGLRFESSICTGQPVFDTTQINDSDLMRFVDAVVGGPAPGQAGGGGDNIVYVADPNGIPRVTILGSRPNGGAKSEACTLLAQPDIEVVDAIQLIDLDVVFTRPLHVAEDVAPKKGQGPKK